MADTLETLALVGTGVKAGAQIGGGIAARDAGKFEGTQLERNATEARAAGQRQGFEQDAKTAQVLGKQRAIGAASGAAMTSPTITDIMGETAQRGEYLSAAERYKGDVESNKDLNAAAAARLKGKNAMTGSILEGIGTGMTGLSKYRSGFALSSPTDDDSVTDVDTGDTVKARRRYG